MRGRRGRRRRKLLYDLTERKGYSHLKEEALDRTMWRAGFGRGFGPVVRQITDDDDDISGELQKFFSSEYFHYKTFIHENCLEN